mmetsp:Transcript_42806/g.138859  ORF Transcript_42806/g.138859 Transcript_42806/m.138859 type:complete len:106 (-) Transcript_42806:304-621(-)
MSQPVASGSQNIEVWRRTVANRAGLAVSACKSPPEGGHGAAGTESVALTQAAELTLQEQWEAKEAWRCRMDEARAEEAARQERIREARAARLREENQWDDDCVIL